MSDQLSHDNKNEQVIEKPASRVRPAEDIDIIDGLPSKRIKSDLENDDRDRGDKLTDDVNEEASEPLEEEDWDDELDQEEFVEDEPGAMDEVGESSEFDEFIQSTLSNIGECQSEIEAFNVKANEEILKVEQKYNQLRQPVYARRNKHINQIPNFWCTVFSKHPQLRRVITDEDFECLKHLNKITIEDFEEGRSGYSMKFFFSQNPWFSNDYIAKDYHLPWHDTPSCTCTTINWHPNRNLTKKEASFFSWFCPQDDASTDDIAEIIKEELWSDPLPCYTMQVNEYESDKSISDDEVVEYEEQDEEAVEYVSSEDESTWSKRPALGKEAPSTSKDVQYLSTEESDEADDDDDDDDDANLLEDDEEAGDEAIVVEDSDASKEATLLREKGVHNDNGKQKNSSGGEEDETALLDDQPDDTSNKQDQET